MSVLHMIFGAIIPFVASIVFIVISSGDASIIASLDVCILCMPGVRLFSFFLLAFNILYVDFFCGVNLYSYFAHFYFVLCQPQISKEDGNALLLQNDYISKAPHVCCHFLRLHWSHSV